MNELRCFKFVIALVLKLKKKMINEDRTKYSVFHSNSKAEINIHDVDIDSIFGSIYSIIMTKIQISVIEQNINVSKYKPLSVSSYVTLLKELNHSKKL